MRKNRSPLFSCLLMLILCASIVVGSTYAQFTDNVVVNGNIISSGRLKAGLSWTESLTPDAEGKVAWQDAKDATIFNYPYWEPGFTDVKFIKIDNTGSLAFQYKLGVVPAQPLTGSANLMDVIDVYYAEVEEGTVVTRADYASKLTRVGTLSEIAAVDMAALQGILLPEKTTAKVTLPESAKDIADTGSVTGCIVLHMQETAGNEYQNLSAGEGFNLQLYATQYTWEEDSFDNSYDEGAKLPVLTAPTNVTMPVQVDANGLVLQAVNFTSPTGVTATVPAGAKVEPGVTELTLVVEFMSRSAADVNLKDSEELASYNVKVVGLAADNTVPVLINLGKVLPEGLNMGNYQLYHVENGTTAAMTLVAALGDPATHNTFTYDPVEGNVSVAMATFSEVAAVADMTKAWEGNFDYNWYKADAKELTIANADQLAAFGAIVGGMAKGENGVKIDADTFAGKTVKLIADVNLGDKESENNPNLIFYPIGYYNSEGTYERTNTAITSGLRNFEGTFDGNGHTISNFYQNTWEMKGDNNYYDATLQYYRDGMGLFGKVYGGTIKNLTVDNFSSDGEYTTTGVIAAYADGATFENIAITNCNPRVYNIGNGGIVGCVGWYAKEANLKTTFKNITVDNSNKISALWGSYDVACGGLVGQYYPTSGQTSANSPKNAGIDFVNCHVSAQMDVYNDVCGNYQYYAYRYAGMIIGSIRENTTNEDGKTIPDMTGISATGCTVNYGDWNDYYYCEFEKNGHPSYSGPDDYKFSRVPHSELKFEDSNNNGVVDANERESVTGCKHNHTDAENNKAIYLPFHQLFTGYGWGVSSIGLEKYSGIVTNLDITEGNQQASVKKFIAETVSSAMANTEYKVTNFFKEKTDLNVNENPLYAINTKNVHVSITSEDTANPVTMQYTAAENWKDGTIVFTGTGRVTLTIQDYQYCTPTKLTVTITEKQPVDKFTATNPTFTHTTEGGTIEKTLGDIFKAVEGVKINSASVVVTIKGDGCNYIKNKDDWTQSKLSFTGKGEVTITITDKDYCKEATATVTITEPDPVAKFALVFPNTAKYLYRVGNKNTVALGSLFAAIEGADIGNVSVTVENVAGNAAGDYTSNATWTKGTIEFSGTGVVKVTIQDYQYCTPTVLYLEVVDATNITSATAGTDKNFVLLKNVTYTGTYLYYKNSTLYGNGFTMDITEADHSDLKDSSDTNSNKSAYCNIWMVDSRFDNVRITGSVYPDVGMTADSDYGNAAIRTEGECYITNSFISNCRVPLRVQGNTTLENTVVDGGRYANIELRSGKLTLDGVTTINTVRKGSDGTTDVIGFGIVIHAEAANASIAVTDDGLKQYNWAGENEHKGILSGDTNLSSAYKLIFNANNSDTIYFEDNDDRFVNTGILCLCANINKDVVTGLDDRYCQEVSGYDAWVLTYDNSKHTDWLEESVNVQELPFEPKQGSVIPNYSGNEAQTVEFTKGETYYFDTSVLTAEKFGQSLNISSVVMNGTTYNYGDKVAITEGGVYEVVYTVVDPYNYNAEAIATTVPHNVSITVTAIAKDAQILAPKFTFIDQNGNKYESTTVKVGDKTYVMPNVTAADPTTNSMSSINIGSASISGTTVYFPVATGYTVRSGSNFNRYYPLFNGINITDYTIAGDTTGTTYTTSGNYTSLVGSSGTKFIIPANGGQTNCGDYVKTDGQAGNAAGNSDSGWQGAGYSTSYGGTYLKSGNTNASSGADKNGYERIVWVEYSFNAGNGDVYYYRIGYHCNKESAQSCVTPDTLITLADGTQVRVDGLTGSEQLLVWNMETGALEAAPIMFVDSDPEEEFEIIHLYFSDGTDVKVIYEHGFWDYDLNKYVYLDRGAEKYIGHTFAKHSGDALSKVKLTDVVVEKEVTTAWSPVTADHLCYFVNGMLSMPGGVGGLFNIFEVDPTTMSYDMEALARDIDTYGLFTYEELNTIVELPEEMFNAAGGAYLKISIGKGNLTMDELICMIERYTKYFK